LFESELPVDVDKATAWIPSLPLRYLEIAKEIQNPIKNEAARITINI
jgi:hypothetical protein